MEMDRSDALLNTRSRNNMFSTLIPSIYNSFSKDDIVHAFKACGLFPFDPARIRELAKMNHDVPMPPELKNDVYKAVTSFLEKKSPQEDPLQAGVVQENQIYDGLGRVKQQQAHSEMLKKMKRQKEKEKTIKGKNGCNMCRLPILKILDKCYVCNDFELYWLCPHCSGESEIYNHTTLCNKAV